MTRKQQERSTAKRTKPNGRKRGPAQPPLAETPPVQQAVPPPPLVPHWDGDRRELLLDGVVLKRYRQHADNQVAVLTHFQEKGWPAVILNPLPDDPNVDSQERLRDTIRRLNLCQQGPRLILFELNGTGTRIIWRIVPAPVVLQLAAG
jgi:hypothetical protein